MAIGIFTNNLKAQILHDTIAWVSVENPIYYANPYNQFSDDSLFNHILNSHGVVYYERALPFAKNPEILKIHEIRANVALYQLQLTLTETYPGAFVNFDIFEAPVESNLYDPADWQWTNLSDNDTLNDWLWHLKKIDADRAWDVTLGDTNLVFAVADFYMDTLHPDIKGQLLLNYDPHQPSYVYNCDPILDHGVAVAGIFSGETAESGTTPNGSYASIGFNTRFYFYNAFSSTNYLLAKALHASNVMGAKVFVSSAGGALASSPSVGEKLIVKEILDNGTTIVMGAGNGPNGTHNNRPNNTINPEQPFYPFHPAHDDRIITVSSTGKNDRHFNGIYTHSHYPEVDLCAPGYNVGLISSSDCGTNNWPYIVSSGTSFASPLVAGTASLMYSANPCLNAYIVKDILKNTTDPILDAGSYDGLLGTGRLNAGNAVEAAQGMYSTGLDLYIKDRKDDFGYSGSYPWGWWFDQSPDIWVRNQRDGLINQVHQKPEYSNDSVYVYVCVWNKSCDSSNGQGILSLFWSKASSCSSWPQNWDGSQPTIGDTIGSLPIPNLAPGEARVLEFKWKILNPYIYNNWSTCLLARIEGITSDPITLYNNHLEHDVYFNNNVALKNTTIVDITPYKELPVINDVLYPHGSFMFIGNGTNEIQTFDVTLKEIDNENNSSLSQESEIHVITDSDGWSIIEQSVRSNPLLEVVGTNEFVVNADSVILQNLTFDAGVRIPIYIGFNFLIDQITTEETYHYSLEQRYSNQSNHLTGSQLFVIRKSPREIFNADAGGDLVINLHDSTSVLGSAIDEPVVYNWYSPGGELIYSGQEAVLSPEITTTYKLEVISLSDGFKDYDDITIEVQQYWLESLYPNPTNGLATIDYEISGANSAYIMVMSSFGTVVNNYILNPSSSSISVDFNSYVLGGYSVILVVDGQAVDVKSLSVQ